MSANFELETQIDEEADRMAEAEVRKHPGLDLSRLRTLIKQRIAQRKDFPL
jgi:antitoxin component of RelBE/YafQ-DinJ toxin-antitoxin module